MSFVKSKTYIMILLIWGLVTLLSLSKLGVTLFVLCLITIIGIPIAFIFAAAPTIFIFLSLICIIGNLLRLINRYIAFLAFPIAIVALIIPPYLGNIELEKQAQALVKNDKKDYTSNEKIKSLAIVQPHGSGMRCPDLCQRALLTGTLNEVILARAKKYQKELIPGQKAKKYRLEKREDCPETSFYRTGGVLRVPGEQWRYGDTRASEILDYKIANGTCLIEEETTVDEAEAILLLNYIDGRGNGATYSYDYYADTVSAMRLAFYKKNSDQKHEMKYQSTGVNILKLMPIYAPTYVYAQGLQFRHGLWRMGENRGDYRALKSQYPLVGFLTKNLGLRLKLNEITNEHKSEDKKDTPKKLDVTKFIHKELNKTSDLSAATKRVITDFFISLNRKKTLSKEETQLALKVLQDERMPIPRHTAAPIRKLAQDDSELSEQFAKALFERLFTIDPKQRENDSDYVGYTMGYLGEAIEALPNHAVLPYKGHLRILARSPNRRIQAYKAFRKFGAFDEGVIPDLIYLIDSANEEFKKSRKRMASWQHPYLGAFYGLCELGEKGKGAIPLLYERLKTRKVVNFGSYWKLTIRTLVSLGANPDEVYEHLKSINKNRSRKHFDRVVRSAQKNITLKRKNWCNW